MNKFRFQSGLGVVIVLGALLLLNACGGGSGAPVSPPPQSKPSTSQAQPATPPQAQPVTPSQTQPVTPPAAQPPPGVSTTRTEIPVSIKDNASFDARVKAGAKVVFVITNTTRDKHTFEAPDFNIYTEIQPGETARYEWTVSDRKGSWDLGCFLTSPGGVHDGMDKGKLTIE